MTSKATSLLAALSVFVLGTSVTHAAVTFDWATVGDAGNAADPLNSGSVPGIGSVADSYQIATKEVNLIQYTEFLNAVAATDLNGLYNPSMASDGNSAGITRSGSSGSYTYSVIGSGLRPVTYVSWSDSARFVNWLQNGQGAGSTETGVYDMSLTTPVRSGSASFWIPSENEWYKAAYFQPVAQGGDTDSYWLYPTQSNTAPGNEIGPGANQANFRDGDFATTPGNNTYSSSQNYLTDGGAFIDSASYYGTYDQGGKRVGVERYRLVGFHAGAARRLLEGRRVLHAVVGPQRLRAHVRRQHRGFPSCQRSDWSIFRVNVGSGGSGKARGRGRLVLAFGSSGETPTPRVADDVARLV